MDSDEQNQSSTPVDPTGPAPASYAPPAYYAAPMQAPPPAQMWLPPGQYLTQSSWRKRWRTPVIIGSSIVGVLLAAIALGALFLGRYVFTPTFVGKGAVAVSCQSSSALGSVEAGTQVTVWTEGGIEEGTTQLEPMRSITDNGKKSCYLPFRVTGLRTDQVGYIVKVSDTYSQFVTTSALSAGVILHPTAGS